MPRDTVAANGRRPTQIDLAREAGVSQATVSQIVNEAPDSPARVSNETRERVLDAAARLGYTMNAAARILKGGRNSIVGLYTFEPVFPTDQRDFYYPFLLGVEERGAALGFDTLLFSGHRRPPSTRSFDDVTSRLRIADGCILLGRHIDWGVLDRLTEDGYPFVFIGRRERRQSATAYVAPDYRSATAEVVRVMAEGGRRRPLLIRQPTSDEPSEDRVAGFLEGCAANGIRGADDLVVEHVPDAAQLAAWRVAGVDAILVDPSEDDTELEAVERVVEETGLTVPGELSLACLGDPTLRPGRLDWMRLDIPRTDLGRAAVTLLSQILDGTVQEVHQLMTCDIVAGATHRQGTRP